MNLTQVCAVVLHQNKILLVPKPDLSAGPAKSTEHPQTTWAVPCSPFSGPELVGQCAERAVSRHAGLLVHAHTQRAWGPGWTSVRESGGRPSASMWVRCDLPLESEGDPLVDLSGKARWVDLNQVGELTLEAALEEVFLGGWLNR